MKMKKMSVRCGRRRCNVKKRFGGGGTPKLHKTSKTRRTPRTSRTPSTPMTEKKKTTTTYKSPKVTLASKTSKTDDMLRISLHFVFTYVSDVNKWHDNIDDVVDAYIAMFKKANAFKSMSPSSPSPSSPSPSSPSPSMQYGGGFNFPFKKYATWLMHTAVGKFDNPCNILISSIALSTYAIMAYAFVQSMQKHNFDVAAATSDETYVYSLATPVKYALYHYFPSVHEFQEQVFVIFDDYIRQVFQSFSERFSLTLASQNPSKAVVSLLRSIYYDGNLYSLLIIKPISCILRHKIKSCNRLC
jgi:hypothetical protein